jgi:uncharacterized protein
MQLYLIDGYNLIPKIAGLKRDNPEDEARLLEILQVFSRLRRQKLEVYLHSGLTAQAGPRPVSGIRIHYVPRNQPIADAIDQHLVKLGTQAKETLVISSNARVQAVTRNHHAPFLDAELFARELLAVPRAPVEPEKPPAPVKKPAAVDLSKQDTKDSPHLSSDEVSEWMDLFKTKKKG